MLRAFSAVQPTGIIHIGNYLGSIKQWLEIEKKYQSLFCVVDYHALTLPQNPQILREKILETAKIYLACGLDPQKTIIFVQSQVSYHTELCWILNTITKIGELNRMIQFKEKAKEHKKEINAALFDYPVLMAADILLYQTDIVPVGEDQKQHVELAKTIAQRFNYIFGKTFKIPQALIKKETKRIMGFDDPLKKMSKSAKNSYNYIALLEKPKDIEEKIKKAVTDSGKEIIFNQKKKPGISNLMVIYSSFANKSIKEIERIYQNKNYNIFKKDLTEIIIEFLKPIQKRYYELEKNRDYVINVLKNGAKEAITISEKTMKEVKKRIGIIEI